MTNTLTLYETYNRDDALAHFNPDAPRLQLCDGDFIALPGNVLAMFTCGGKPGATVSTPSEVIWRPIRLNYSPGDQYPFLPIAARDVSGTINRRHHLFLREHPESSFIYFGLAHLGVYGGSDVDPTGRFSLDEKLTRPFWLQFGGYPEWQIATNNDTHQLGVAQLAEFQELLAEAFGAPHSHLTLTRYDEDSLQVFTNPERAWFMYLRTPDDSGLYLSESPISDTHEEHFVCDCGIDLDFPRDKTTDHATAARILCDFFSKGTLPSSVVWDDVHLL